MAFSSTQIFEFEVLDLNALIAGLEAELRRIAGEDIELTTILDSNLISVKVDRMQVEQVIKNLVINARNAMTGGGKLTIKTGEITLDEGCCKLISGARPGRFVCLSVTDSGAGLDNGFIEHIFEPFAYRRKVGGDSGLGLSVVHGIVKQHRGWINVRSAPQQGSTFTVYLPAFYVEAEAQAGEVVSSGRLQSGVHRIMVMED